MEAFETCSLPRDGWNHRAHLTVAMWYMTQHDERKATSFIREGIQKYNHACGIIQTENTGYHETITLFYVWLVGKYLKMADDRSSIVELTNSLLNEFGDKKLPLEYYTREKLFSWEARVGWVEPDLRPLD